ncbi:MAG: 50S ribosomal protein L3 [Planctomycetes bacterium]|nr:50S ribosomal protein L3 [Planctomycetota bacterium]
MTQVFSEAGRWIPVTVLQAGPCTVLQVKTPRKDGYSAVQIGFGDSLNREGKPKQRKKPQQGLFDKLGVVPKRYVREVPFVEESALLSREAPPPPPQATGGAEGGEAQGPVAPGARVGVAVFKDVRRVDVRGITKGRGFQGVIRRHHFDAGPKSHGSKNIREPKSTGMHTDPGRVHKGKRMPGHMGAVHRKVRNLAVVRLEEAENILVVEGAVPGPNGGYVYIEESLR